MSNAGFCRRWAATLAALGWTLLAAHAAAAAGATMDPHDLSGVWWADHDQRLLEPDGGGSIPFTAAGLAAYQSTVAGLKSGKLADQAGRLCVPEGVPRAMASLYPIQIVETDHLIVMVLESNRIYRIIRMNEPHEDPIEWDPSYMGDSIGRWNGAALTIETTNFNDETTLDASGLPHSDQLQTVEHLQKSHDGRTLTDLVTIDDPVMYRRPWTVKLSYQLRSGVQVQTDWVCGEPHRDVSQLLSGARPNE